MPSGRIILAEDDATSRSVFAEVLRGAGYEVVATETAEEALEQVSLAQPSLLLLDIQLPGIDGREACRRARKLRGPDMPILFVTVSDTIEALDACLKAGGNDFLIKTERPIDILKRVNMWQDPRLRNDMERRRSQALARVDKAIKTGAGLSGSISDMRDALMGPTSVGDLDAWLDGQDDAGFGDEGSLDFDDFNPLDAFGAPETAATPAPRAQRDATPSDLEELPWEPAAGPGGNGRDPGPITPPALPGNGAIPDFAPDEDLADSFFDALDSAPDPAPAAKPKKRPSLKPDTASKPDMASKDSDDLNELRWD